jgi:hypothetical protein
MAKKAITPDNGGSLLKFAALFAMLGDIEHPKDKQKSNAHKKRMLSSVHGIDFPEDFDQLPEAEQTRRLDGAIKIATKK